MITVAITNHSTALTDSQVAAIVPALQKQVTHDFCPIWGIDAVLIFVAADRVPAGAWPLRIFDDSPQADALGYHECDTLPPKGFAFVKSDIEGGSAWTTTVSHELLEMLADPFCFSAVARERPRGRDLLESLEVCDACEADQFGYTIDGVLVSDFVTPAWFGSPGDRFDLMGHITEPWQLLPGGYISVEKAHLVGDWVDIVPKEEKQNQNPPGGGEAPVPVAAPAASAEPSVPDSPFPAQPARHGRHIELHDGSPMPLEAIPRHSRKHRRLFPHQRS